MTSLAQSAITPTRVVESGFTHSLQVRSLAKRFQGGTAPVFQDVSFDVRQGQAVALIGANGAGKSTLLRCCVRLIEPDEGDIVLAGERLSAKQGRELRRARNRVGFVFQKHCLVPRLSALSNVLHGNLAHKTGPRNWLHGFSSREDRERAMDCLDMVGLSDLAHQRCDQLSGGQSQRVAIARALMQEPGMLLADEPTASLDPRSGAAIMELFAKLSRSRGLTLLFVSHQVEHALHYADRILGLREHQLMLDSATATESLASLRGFYV
ncbi:MAG: ATP-binding cassette domain-containing protein [Marinobacter sp.]